MRTAIVLFTRDLRIHDNPALAAAAEQAEQIVPLFVLDERILASEFARPNRVSFLLEALNDLGSSLQDLGGRLIVRRGDVVAETIRVAREAGARAIFMSGDVSSYATARARRLGLDCSQAGIPIFTFPSVTVIAPGELRPLEGDHFKIFTPYWRRWLQAVPQPVAVKPERLSSPGILEGEPLPALKDPIGGAASPERPRGGESEGRRLMTRWIASGLEQYGDRQDLAHDSTSRLSPYLLFGCVSPLELVQRVKGRPGAEPFIRQLCWRDFYHQLLAANPASSREDYRPRGDRWRTDEDALATWRDGRVDAGMRQLIREGWMHNGVRLIVASFLVKDLYLDWRAGHVTSSI